MEEKMKSVAPVILVVLLRVTVGVGGQRDRSHGGDSVVQLDSEPRPPGPLLGWQEDGGERALPGHQGTVCLVGKPCGENHPCCCEDHRAWCTNQGLLTIPLLPAAVTWLDFDHNRLHRLHQDTLHNLTAIGTLRLRANNITFVHPEAFRAMKRLKVLQLSDNRLNDFSHLLSALAHADRLEYLDASINQFQNVSLSALQAVPWLTTLLLSGTGMTRILKGQPPAKRSRLRALDISDNLLTSFPDVCSPEAPGFSLLPDLEELSVEWNLITGLDPHSPACLPRLTTLKLGGNAIHHLQRNFLQGFPRLESLILQFCMSKQIDSHAFNHSHLRVLDVSENLWFFDSQHGSGISTHLFRWLPQMERINMSWTVFRFSQGHERHAILSSLRHVKGFALLGTGLDFIPKPVLREFTNLTHLSFGRNDITLLPDDTFENLTSLTSLDLSENHLTYVSQSLLEKILNRPNASLDLSNNPFACTCDLLWFIERYKEDYQRKEGERVFSGGTYKCKSPHSQRNADLAEVNVTARTCTLNRDIYIVIMFVTTLTLLLLIFVAIAYKYRWQLRFMFYTLQHRLFSDGATRPAPHAVYDVFVSYDSEDSGWVMDTLIPELEGRRGLRLCVHERDFTPGMFITHNIMEKMEESDTILPLLSNSFLASDWCRFELFLALKIALRRTPSTAAAAAADDADAAALRRRVRVVPLLLEDLEREGVDSLLCALLNTTTYLAWPSGGGGDREGERERFWRTLCSVLQRGRGRGGGGELGDLP